jgi:hypothetical protein
MLETKDTVLLEGYAGTNAGTKQTTTDLTETINETKQTVILWSEASKQVSKLWGENSEFYTDSYHSDFEDDPEGRERVWTETPRICQVRLHFKRALMR